MITISLAIKFLKLKKGPVSCMLNSRAKSKIGSLLSNNKMLRLFI